MSLFQPGSSADTAAAVGSVEASAVAAGVLLFPLFSLALPPALLLLEQPDAEKASISPKSSSTIDFGLRFMPMLIYPFSKMLIISSTPEPAIG
ncbi:hypothetical protein D3C73_1382600 [compost metagenome]